MPGKKAYNVEDLYWKTGVMQKIARSSLFQQLAQSTRQGGRLGGREEHQEPHLLRATTSSFSKLNSNICGLVQQKIMKSGVYEQFFQSSWPGAFRVHRLLE